MNDLDPLERKMREWRPRRPAARLARRLFGQAELAPATLRRAEFWNWLTPVAACALTVLVAVGSAGHRGGSLEGKGGPVPFSGLSSEFGASNLPWPAQLSQMDENVQWNVCPELAAPAGTSNGESAAPAGKQPAAATNLNRN
jgi:hypothetical protein